jgi:CRISPR-associated endonuclease/helicase Cas3
VHVFDVDTPKPYDENLIKDTRKVLEKRSITLDWNTEIELINHVLGRHFVQYLNLGLMYEILGILSRAAYEGARNIVEKAVREVYSCDLSIHSNPSALGDDVRRLPKVRVDSRVLQSKFAKKDIVLWRIDEDPYWSDYKSKFYARQVNSKYEILPFRFYVADPKNVSYNHDEGLVFGHSGEDFELPPEDIVAGKSKKQQVQQTESWIKHSLKTLEIFDTEFALRFDFVIDKFSSTLQMKKKRLLSLMRVAIGLHDIGKLNVHWQKAIGWKEGEEPLAHSYSLIRRPLPPHATVSAISLQRVFAPLGESLWESFMLAIAHHHALRARECPAFKLVDDYASIIKETGLDIDTSYISPVGRGTSLRPFIEIRGTQNKYYRLYSLLSKCLRLSDWIATGGGTYESLFYP